MSFPTAHWCRSRRGRALCTRPKGHPGLHNRLGTSQMWSDTQADPPGCRGSHQRAEPAAMLADGYPFGRALCSECTAFVALEDGRLAAHDAYRAATDDDEDSRRRAWFNAVGWN